MASSSMFPPSPKDELTRLYVGKSIRDVPTPAAVMDVSIARRNCYRMLATCKSLKLSWRAHVKTHKASSDPASDPTAELTRLQVGESPFDPVNLVISTLTEVEFFLPTLHEFISQGRPVNILYGLPVAPGSIPRLAAIGRALGKDTISVLLDYTEQVDNCSLFGDFIPHVYIKVNIGGQRVGVVPRSDDMRSLIRAALKAQKGGRLLLRGLYSHAGHSYGGDSRVAALHMLRDELVALVEGAEEVSVACRAENVPVPTLTLSVGASPTALAVQNLLSGEEDARVSVSELKAAADELASLFDRARGVGHVVEIHAGVYPTLDLQQLAAHSLSSSLLS